MAEDNTKLIQHLERKLEVFEAASDSERYAELAEATKAKLDKLKKPAPKPKAKSSSSKAKTKK